MHLDHSLEKQYWLKHSQCGGAEEFQSNGEWIFFIMISHLKQKRLVTLIPTNIGAISNV